MSGPALWKVIAPSVKASDTREAEFVNYMQEYLKVTYFENDIV